MALTMTRTRTQTALTKLAELVANIHGELEFIKQISQKFPEHQAALEARQHKLEADRDALYQTLKQFGPELEPTDIGTSDDWIKEYGRGKSKQAERRYLISISAMKNGLLM